jgi:hypothetical protein
MATLADPSIYNLAFFRFRGEGDVAQRPDFDAEGSSWRGRRADMPGLRDLDIVAPAQQRRVGIMTPVPNRLLRLPIPNCFGQAGLLGLHEGATI